MPQLVSGASLLVAIAGLAVLAAYVVAKAAGRSR